MTPGGLILLKRKIKDGRVLYKKAPGDKLGGRDRLGHERGRDTRTQWWRDTQGTQRDRQGTHRLKQREGEGKLKKWAIAPYGLNLDNQNDHQNHLIGTAYLCLE